MATKKLLLSDLTSNVNHVPSNYVRPIADRPNLHEVRPLDGSIPLIDLQSLNDAFLTPSNDVINKIGQGCQNYGFFQVKNHGIPEAVIDDMLTMARAFFHMPESERLKNYSDDPLKTTRLSTSFNVNSEKVSNWRDFLRLYCYPLEDYVHEWPSNPPSFKVTWLHLSLRPEDRTEILAGEDPDSCINMGPLVTCRKVVAEYCRHIREVALKLLEAMSESLGLERNYINRALGKHGQHMALNYCPPCPQPELTYGLPGHADPNAITILLQDDVPGLQIHNNNNNNWVSVNPIQVISNDRYKSVVHRAVVNSSRERISIPTFYCPSEDAVMGPAPEMIDDNHPALYRSFAYADYYHKFCDKALPTHTSCLLDMFKTPAPAPAPAPASSPPPPFF